MRHEPWATSEQEYNI